MKRGARQTLTLAYKSDISDAVSDGILSWSGRLFLYFCQFFSLPNKKKKKQWSHSFSIIKIEQTYSKHCEYVKKAAGLTNKTNNVAI